MQHKIDQNLNHLGSEVQQKKITENKIQSPAEFKMPQSHFKDYLKSKVHRPHVTPEFIQNIKNFITKD